jgi:2-polyprenyl-3-methyl-5-hydroxy-6-metoxy-1,4-benzoquinol methylase
MEDQGIAELCGVRVAFCTAKPADAPPESARLWPLTELVATRLTSLFPPPHGLNGKTVLELGAGTAALSCAVAAAYPTVRRVCATDLAEVVPLMASTVAANGAEVEQRVTAADCLWGDARRVAQLLGPEEGSTFDVVLCCECLYWGGWDLLHDDTRDALLTTLGAACGPQSTAIIAFTVRDVAREVPFLGRVIQECGFTVDAGSSAWQNAREGEQVVVVLKG